MIDHLPPGQRTILRSFGKHGLDSCYVASDMMDWRVCNAMSVKGLLAGDDEIPAGFNLTDAGRAALEQGDRP